MSRKTKTVIALVLSLVLVITSTLSALAGREVVLHPDDTDDTVVRISNPDNEPRQADGLSASGDRETGYGWSIAERGDYIYIGTWKNTVGVVVAAYLANALDDTDGDGTPDADNSDLMWGLVDVFTNGDIPRPTEGIGGEIVKMRKDDPGNFETIFTCADSFRNVAVYGDDLYFATYAGPRIPYGAKAAIYKVDENDDTTLVYETAQGSSMRANAVLNDKLYFAGTYVTDEIAAEAGAETLASHAFLAVIEKHTEDDGWNLVADEDDFGAYCNDSYVTATAGSPFWDMAAHNGELYATIPGQTGFVIFAGHPAEPGEDANKYGWNWREVVGRNNGVNNQGLHPGSANGYTQPGQAGFLSVISALVEFNGDLYTYDIDHTIVAEVNAVGGIAELLFGGDPAAHKEKALSYWLPLYSTINHPQGLWKLDDSTGKFEKVEGFTDLMEGTTNEYVWKHGIYNDELYIGTMDSKVIYNYLTRFFGFNMAEMNMDEWADQLTYVKNLLEIAQSKGMIDEGTAGAASAVVDAVISVLEFDVEFDRDAYLALFHELFGTKEKALKTLESISELLLDIDLRLSAAEGGLMSVSLAGSFAEAAKDLLESVPEMDDETFGETVSLIADGIKSSLVEEYGVSEEDADALIGRILTDDTIAAAKSFITTLVSSPYWDSVWNVILGITDRIVGYVDTAIQAIGIVREVVEAFPEDSLEDIIDFLYDNDYDEISADYAEIIFNALKELVKKYVNESLKAGLTDFTEKAQEYTNVAIAALNMINVEFAGADSEEAVEKLGNVLTLFDFLLSDSGLNIRLSDIYSNMEDAQKEQMAEYVVRFADLLDTNVNWDAVTLYMSICESVRDDVQGFDIVKSSDGENWTLVTNDGFGDKWNYGALRFLPTDQGMYITTANPFYGTQLYLLTNGEAVPVSGGEARH